MQRLSRTLGRAWLGILLLSSGRAAAAETVALVVASPASEDAARFLETQIDQTVVRRETTHARDLDALVGEARGQWRADLVVVVDTDRAIVSVVRPEDGTMGSRALAPSAAQAPYAVALAAVELLEIVRNAPQARAARLPERRPRRVVPRMSFEAGLVQSVGTNGEVGLLQPTAGVDFELTRERQPAWFSVGIHGTGLVPMHRDQMLSLPTGADGGSVQYGRNELSLRLGVGHRQGLAAVFGWCDMGLAFVDVRAKDHEGNQIARDQRSAFWLGVGAQLRYTLAGGFALGLGAGGAWFPVTSRFYASPPGAPAPTLALEEGNLEFRANAAVVWEFPP